MSTGTYDDDTLFSTYYASSGIGNTGGHNTHEFDIYDAYVKDAKAGFKSDTSNVVIKHMLDIAHSLYSPITFCMKSVSEGIGAGIKSAMETGTREITGSVGKVIEHNLSNGFMLGIAVLVIATVTTIAWYTMVSHTDPLRMPLPPSRSLPSPPPRQTPRHMLIAEKEDEEAHMMMKPEPKKLPIPNINHINHEARLAKFKRVKQISDATKAKDDKGLAKYMCGLSIDNLQTLACDDQTDDKAVLIRSAIRNLRQEWAS